MKNNVNVGADNKTLPKGNSTYTSTSTDGKKQFVLDYMGGGRVEPSVTPLKNEDGCYGTDYVKGCWQKLPCGICRITNQPCPYGSTMRYEITC